LQALYAPEDNLLYRLNLLANYLRIREKYGIDIPLIILSGKKDPLHYSEEMIKQDLKDAAVLLQHKSFPFLENKDIALQRKMLRSLFKALNYPQDLTKIPHQDKDLENMLKRINLIGGKQREMAYMEQHWHAGLQQQKVCFLRAVTLGHIDVVKKMLEKDFDASLMVNSTTDDTALHIATNHDQHEIAALLLQYNSDINAKNKAEQTPLQIAQQRKDNIMLDLFKTKALKKPVAKDFSNYSLLEYERLGKKDIVLSTTWFAHRFPHAKRTDQITFIDYMLKKHMGKALSGSEEDLKMMTLALNKLEQTMQHGVTYKTHTKSRLQTIVNDLRKELKPITLTEDDIQRHQARINAYLEADLITLKKDFKRNLKAYDPHIKIDHPRPAYRR